MIRRIWRRITLAPECMNCGEHCGRAFAECSVLDLVEGWGTSDYESRVYPNPLATPGHPYCTHAPGQHDTAKEASATVSVSLGLQFLDCSSQSEHGVAQRDYLNLELVHSVLRAVALDLGHGYQTRRPGADQAPNLAADGKRGLDVLHDSSSRLVVVTGTVEVASDSRAGLIRPRPTVTGCPSTAGATDGVAASES